MSSRLSGQASMMIRIIICILCILTSFPGHSTDLSCRRYLGVYRENPPSLHDQISNYDLSLFQEAIEVNPRRRVLRQEKEQAKQDFLAAFKNSSILSMIRLVREFPFLKTVRYSNDPYLLSRIREKDLKWCPKGWSPIQIASYIKDIELLNFLLGLDMDVYSIKRPGGENLESNPLHIAIKKDFKEGAMAILHHVGFQKFGSIPRRFIDEKDHLKQTPWLLAVKNDLDRQRIHYILLIGRYKPSGYVKSYTSNGGPKDGYEIARSTRVGIIINMAQRFLVAPNYKHYQEIRRESPRPDLTPPSH